MDLTDEQWKLIQGVVEEDTALKRPENGGRPAQDSRAVLNGILWILRTGAPWADMPRRYPPYQTCHRRLQQWEKSGTFDRLLRMLAEDLRERGKLDLSEAYVDGSHAGAKRGALWLGSLDAAKRPRSWQWQTATVFLSRAGLRVVRDMKRLSSKTS
jgi:transposase